MRRASTPLAMCNRGVVPIVLAHGRALLAENASTGVIVADMRSPDEVLDNPELRSLIDFDQPVGLLMVAIVHHFNDDEDPHALVRRYVDALPSGSHLFLTHFVDGGAETAEIERVLLGDLGTGRFRGYEEIAAFFDGLGLLEP